MTFLQYNKVVLVSAFLCTANSSFVVASPIGARPEEQGEMHILMAGANPIVGNGTNGDASYDARCASSVTIYKVRLHIPLELLSNLAYNYQHPNSNVALCSGQPSCVSVLRSDGKELPDKTQEDYLPPPTFSVPTPFDIDLVSNLAPNPIGAGGSPPQLPIADGIHPVLIEVILDDPQTQFIKDSNGTFALSIEQAEQGKGMFVCAPLPDNPHNPRMLTVRAIPKAVTGMLGGLNIGVQFPLGATVMPLYIDPQVKNPGK